TQFTFATTFTQGPHPVQSTTTAGSPLAAFLLGIPGGTTAPSPALAQQSFYVAGFVQDQWKVTQNLTVNLGLRYEVEFPRTDRFNQFTKFDNSLAPPLNTPGMHFHGALTFGRANGDTGLQAYP